MNSYEATSEAVLVVLERRVDFPTLEGRDQVDFSFVSAGRGERERAHEGNPWRVADEEMQ